MALNIVQEYTYKDDDGRNKRIDTILTNKIISTENYL